MNLAPTSKELVFEASSHGQSWQISARTWGELQSSKAAVLLVHGLGAHAGWFEGFARRLADNGLFAFSYDQVGFGKRRKEKFYSRQQWLDDLSASHEYLQSLVGDKPLYLAGNSMGAVVAINQASTIRPAALLLFSPGFDGHPVTFNWPYKIAALLTGLILPENQIELPYTVDDITPSQSVRDFLNNDPDRRFTLDARMGVELLKLTRATQSKIKNVPCPMLMATAGVEKIVDNRISEQMFQKLSAPGKKRLRFDNAWHDLMFDPCLDELVCEVISWLDSLCIKSPARRETPAL